MAPALTTEPADKHPECVLPPCRPRRIGRSLAQLLKSNLKNLLADCSGRVVVVGRGGAGARQHAAAPAARDRPPLMNDAPAEPSQPTQSRMNTGERELDHHHEMGLHTVNSQSLQELLLNKSQLTGQLAAAADSPPPDLADIMREFEGDECAPTPGRNGDVVPAQVRTPAELVCAEDVTVEPAVPSERSPQAAAPSPAAMTEAARARQLQLETRLLMLMRRLRVLQARSARRQTTLQGDALLERVGGAAAASSPAATPANSDIASVLRSPNAKHFSTTQLVNLVLSNRCAEVSSTACRVDREQDRPAAACQVSRLVAAHDSDATESSSGGESADEFDHGWEDAARDRAAPIRKRALWRWTCGRSTVASRWSWLSAQVADLEFRIRQLRQLHRQLRAAQSAASDEQQRTRLHELGGAGDASSASSAALRSSSKSDADAASLDDTQCARTRPRRARQNARVFSVWRAPGRGLPAVWARCRCDPGCQSCATCLGSRQLWAGAGAGADAEPLRQRMAQLEPSCHPVLALPGELPLSLSYDTLLRSSRWQQNHLHARPRRPSVGRESVSAPAADGAGASVAGGAATAHNVAVTRPSYHRRKPGVVKRSSELDQQGELSLSSVSSAGHGHGQPAGAAGARLGRPPKWARRGRSTSSGAAAEEYEPRPSPLHRYRHRQQSYDIDNIVIPASMASNTKIEKPKYKEIVTPGWRTVELRPAAVNGSGPGCPQERLDDATFEERHRVAELAERRRLYNCRPQLTQVAAPAGDGAYSRMRRLMTPEPTDPADPTSAATDSEQGGDHGRPRLRHLHLAQPCGFPSRQFPLSEVEWHSVQLSAERAHSSPAAWRWPASPADSSTESAPETAEH